MAGASPEVISLLSSSPVRFAHRSAATPSSSPGELSRFTFARPRPVLRTGSRAKQLPEGVTNGFCSAREIWSSVSEDMGQEESELAQDATEESKTRKMPVEEHVANEVEKEPDSILECLPASSMENTKTKAHSAGNMAAFKNPRDLKEVDSQTIATEELGMKRKEAGEWEMEKRNEDCIHDYTAEQDQETNFPEHPKDEEALADIQGVFGHNEQCTRIDESIRTACERIETKKNNKHFEVENHTESNAPFRKNKPLSKSSKTVTSFSLARWKNQESEDHGDKFFDHNGAKSAALRGESIQVTKEAPLSNSTGKERKATRSKTPKASAKRKAKEVKPPPKILSGEQFQFRVNNQDLLFGSSSQIVRDEPASDIRELQRALKVSTEECTSKELEQSLATAQGNAPVRNHLLELMSRTVASKGLWSASSRDDAGALLVPEPIAQVHPLQPKLNSQDSPTSDGFTDINELGLDGKVPLPLIELSLKNGNASSRPQEDSQTSPRKRIRLSSTTSFTALKCASQFQESTVSKPPARPLTMAGTARAMSTSTEKGKTEAKASKKVEGKTRSKSSVLKDEPSVKKPRGRPRKVDPYITNTTEEVSTEKKQKNTKPRKRKQRSNSIHTAQAVDKWADIDEIEDSEPEPSTPHRCRTPTVRNASATPQLALSPRLNDAAKEASKEAVANKAEEKAVAEAKFINELFSFITKAVKSEPRSVNHKLPTFHEKMLLYDPIVIEDFTVWLKSGPLLTAGREKHDDVKTVHVQRWCEANSVCCLWRETVRGIKKGY